MKTPHILHQHSTVPERRRFTRLSFTTRARLCRVGSEQCIAVSLLDLCLQGALVELMENNSSASYGTEHGIIPTYGKIMRLDLFLDEVETVISMETEVVYARGRNIGLSCRAVDLDSITHLRRLVELNLGDAELFQREIALLGQPIIPPVSKHPK